MDRYSRKFAILKSYTPILSEILATMDLSSEARPEFEWQLYTLLVSLENNRKIFTYEELLSCEIFFNEIRAHGPLELRYHMEQIDRRRYLNEPANQNITRFHPYMSNLINNLPSRNIYMTEKSQTKGNTSSHLSTTTSLRHTQDTNSTNTEPAGTPLATENDHLIENHPLGNSEPSTTSSVDAKTLQLCESYSEREIVCIEDNANKSNQSSFKPTNDSIIISMQASDETTISLINKSTNEVQAAVDSECMNNIPSPVTETTPIPILNVSIDSNDSKSISITELNNELSAKTITTVAEFCEISDTASSTNQMEVDIVVENEPTVEENTIVNEELVEDSISLGPITPVTSDSNTDEIDFDANNFSCPQQINTELSCGKIETNNVKSNYKILDVVEMIVDSEYMDVNHIVSSSVSSEMVVSSDENESHTITEFQNQFSIEPSIAEDEVNTIEIAATVSSQQITGMLDNKTNSNYNTGTLLIDEPSKIQDDEIVDENVIKIPDGNLEEKFGESDIELSQVSLQNYPGYYYQHEYALSSTNCNESDQDHIYHPILPGFTSGFNKFDDKYFITMITSDKPVTDTAKDSNIVRLKYHFRGGLKFEIENKDESDYILYTITNGEKQKFTGRFSELKLHLLDLCKNSENYDETFYIFVFLALMNVDNGSIDNYLRCNQYPEKISSEVEEKDASRIYNINKILNAFNPEQIILINTQNENQNDEENISNDFAISELNDFEEIISPIYEHINVQKANYDIKVLEPPAITVTTIDLNERDNENVADSTPINCITDSVMQTNAKNETEKCIMNVDENSLSTNRASGELNKHQASIRCNPKNEKCILNSNSLQSAIEIDESPKIKPVNVRKRKSKSRAVRKLPQTSSIKTDMYDKISSYQMSQTTDREIQNTNAPVMPDCNVETATDTEHQETIGKNVIQTRSKTMTKKSTSKNLKDESSDSLKRNIKMILRKPKKPLNEKTLAVVTEGCLPGKLLLNATDTVCDAIGDKKIENLQTILPSNNTNPVYSNSSNAYDEIGRTTCTEEIRNLNRIKYQKKTKNGKSTIRVPSNDNLHVGNLGDKEYFAGDNDDRKLNSKSASVGNKDKKVPAKKIMEFATALQEIAKQKCLNNVVKSTMPATNQRTESTTSQITSSIEIVEMNINNRNLVEGIQSSKNSSSKEICIKFTLPSNNASENMNQAAVANFANERDLDDPCNSEITGIESVRTDFYVDTKGDKTRTDPVADKECEREKIFLADTSDALVNSTETAEDIIEHHSVSQFEIESFKKGDSGISLTASDVFEESMETIENPGIITSHYTGKSNDVRTQRLSCDTNAMFIEPLIPIDRIKVEETYDCDRNFNSDLVDSVENEESSDILPTSNHFIRTTGTYHVTQNDGIPVTSGHGASTSQAVLNEELKIEERQRSDIESDKEMVEPSKNGIADAPLRLSDDPYTASATKDRIILFGKFIESNTSLNRNSRMKLRRNSISVNEVINLTPWLKTKVFKKKVNAIHMLMKVKLQHLFKCVDPECSFTTNRSSEMVQHLDYHDTTTDSRLFRKCAYCSVSIPNTSYLVSHITDEHGESRYQCLYCFYRSCAHVNVINHQKNLHQGLPLSVLICAGSEPDGLRIREDIERNRKKFVLPFVCSECQISFFLWDQYYEHLKTMHAENGEICNVCERKFSIDMMQQHYLTHNMGMFQCLHCFFSSNLRNNIERHMSSQHASKIPFTLVRIMSPHYKHKNQCPTNIQDQCSPIEAAYIIILETKAEENRRELCPDLLAMYESEVISISSDSDE